MTNTQVEESLRETIIKLDGAMHQLYNGKSIPGYQKLCGVKDKLNDLRNKIVLEDKELIKQFVTPATGNVSPATTSP
jgi:hypothetical protein